MQAKLYLANILFERDDKMKNPSEVCTDGFYSNNEKSGAEIHFQHQRYH